MVGGPGPVRVGVVGLGLMTLERLKGSKDKGVNNESYEDVSDTGSSCKDGEYDCESIHCL